jgi:FAD/FMN-containing dehydrogenase
VALGTLAVIAQVALKVRPLPRARRTLRFEGGLDLTHRLLEAVPGAAAALATTRGSDVLLEGWPQEVEEQTASAAAVAAPIEAEDDAVFPSTEPWFDGPVVVEVAAPPSRLEIATTGEAWELSGVGLAWVGLGSADGELETLRERVRAAGGIAPVVKGPGGLGDEPVPAPEVHVRWAPSARASARAHSRLGHILTV